MGKRKDLFCETAPYIVHEGDCLRSLKRYPENTFDAAICDPPGGAAFMGLDWDKDRGGRSEWVSYWKRRFADMLRTMKPGAIGLVWANPDTSHWTGLALDEARFWIVGQIVHTFGQGYPPSKDTSKAIDQHFFMLWAKAEVWPYELLRRARARWKRVPARLRKLRVRRLERLLKRRAGLLRPVVGVYRASGNAGTDTSEKGGTYAVGAANSEAVQLTRTIGATPEARRWDGWGSQLRPAHEIWWIVQKPYDCTIAEKALKHGLGGLNIDACRIPRSYGERSEAYRRSGHSQKPEAEKIAAPPSEGINLHPLGGWPSTVCISHSLECTETVCVDDCPAKLIDDQSGYTRSSPARSVNHYSGHGPTYSEGRCFSVSPGSTYGDEGGASRFYNRFWTTAEDVATLLYYAKANTADREAGCEQLPKVQGFAMVHREQGAAGADSPAAGAGRTSEGRANFHATVKRTAFIAHLCRLACPKGGLIVDITAGSGTTGKAAILEDMRAVLMESEPAYVPLIRARCEAAIRVRAQQRVLQERAERQLLLFPPPKPPPPEPEPISAQIDLFQEVG